MGIKMKTRRNRGLPLFFLVLKKKLAWAK